MIHQHPKRTAELLCEKKSKCLYTAEHEREYNEEISFTCLKRRDGATEKEKERTEGGQAEKRTIPSSYVGECPGYK